MLESVRATFVVAAHEIVCRSNYHLVLGFRVDFGNRHSVGQLAQHIRQQPPSPFLVALDDLTVKKPFAQCLVGDAFDHGIARVRRLHIHSHVEGAVSIVDTDDLAVYALESVVIVGISVYLHFHVFV